MPAFFESSLLLHTKAKARVFPYKFCSYFIDRGFANRAKSWIQRWTNTVHYHFCFLKSRQLFWNPRSVFTRKVWGLPSPWSSIPPKHRFMLFLSILVPKKEFLRFRNENKTLEGCWFGPQLRISIRCAREKTSGTQGSTHHDYLSFSSAWFYDEKPSFWDP